MIQIQKFESNGQLVRWFSFLKTANYIRQYTIILGRFGIKTGVFPGVKNRK